MDPKNLETHVHHLVHPNGREPGTPGHSLAQQYIHEQLAKIPLPPYNHDSFSIPYQCDSYQLINIIAQIESPNASGFPILVAAHYDTCGPYPGADDNAAAVSILLELAKKLHQNNSKIARPIILAFFDAEEPPFYLTPMMGSIYFYHHQLKTPVHSVIVLDLCGHDIPIMGLEDVLFITGVESSPAWMNIVDQAVEKTSMKIIPTLNRYIGDMSDYYIFRINKVPYLFFSCGRWEHYHQPTDTPEKLNYEKMAHIGNFLLEIIKIASSAEIPIASPHFDPAAYEIQYLKKHVGHILAALNINPKDRQDLDYLVQMFIQQMGL